MPNAERIAELQRLAFGAGTSDDERDAAADELEALRRRAAASTAADGAEGAPREPGPLDDSTGADEESPGALLGLEPARQDAGTGPPPSTAAAVTRWAVLVGAITLAIGFGAGWAGASIAAAELTAEAGGTSADRTDEDVAFPLAAGEADVTVPVDGSPAIEVFAREPTEAELAFDPAPFAHVDLVPASPRLLVTRSDGVAVWVARTAQGDVCLSLRIDEYSSGGGCTVGGVFPAEGVGTETFIQSRGYYAAWLEPDGDVRMRVDGVRGAAGS